MEGSDHGADSGDRGVVGAAGAAKPAKACQGARLPASVLRRVYAFLGDMNRVLPNVTVVCKSWARAAHHMPVVSVAHVRGEAACSALCDSLRRAAAARELTLLDCALTGDSIATVLRDCTRLSTLRLTRWTPTSGSDLSFANIYDVVRRLGEADSAGEPSEASGTVRDGHSAAAHRTAGVEGGGGGTGGASGEGAAPLVLSRSLRRLALESTASVTCLSYLLSTCPNLRALEISSNPDLAAGDVEGFEDSLPRLEELSFARCPGVKDMMLRFIAPKLSSVTSVDISGCRGVTDAGVVALAEALGPRLRRLNLVSCAALTDAVMPPLAQFLSGLVALGVPNRVSDEGFHLFCMVAKNGVSADSALAAAAGGAGGGGGAATLRELDMAQCGISDASITAIARTFPALQSLSLRWCGVITDRRLHELAELPDLRKLVLEKAARVAEWGVVDLVKASASLKHVDVRETRCDVAKVRRAAAAAALARGSAAGGAASAGRSDGDTVPVMHACNVVG